MVHIFFEAQSHFHNTDLHTSYMGIYECTFQSFISLLLHIFLWIILFTFVHACVVLYAHAYKHDADTNIICKTRFLHFPYLLHLCFSVFTP